MTMRRVLEIWRVSGKMERSFIAEIIDFLKLGN